jgi:hypothetical protein
MPEALKLQDRFTPIEYFKRRPGAWEIWGQVTYGYGHGFFIDLPVVGPQDDRGKRFLRCLARNLRNRVIMLGLLAEIAKWAESVYPSRTAFRDALQQYLLASPAERAPIRPDLRMMFNSVQLLKEFRTKYSGSGIEERVGRAYFRNHRLIKKVLRNYG